MYVHTCTQYAMVKYNLVTSAFTFSPLPRVSSVATVEFAGCKNGMDGASGIVS